MTLRALRFALHMSAYGPKRTSLVASHMSAFEGKADIGLPAPDRERFDATVCPPAALKSLLNGRLVRLPPRPVAVVDNRAYRKWRGAAPLRGR
jgi:hypothetical protein